MYLYLAPASGPYLYLVAGPKSYLYLAYLRRALRTLCASGHAELYSLTFVILAPTAPRR